MDFAAQVKKAILEHDFKPIVIEATKKHEQMLKRSRKYRESHLEQCRKKSNDYDKAHPEKRRERWRRWKERQKLKEVEHA